MTEQHKEEALSKAYIYAIAARAGATVSIRDYDYGIDVSFHEIVEIDGDRIECGATFNSQLKASTHWNMDTTSVIYDIKADAYNRLVTIKNKATVPCILILMCLPKDPVEWHTICEEYLLIRKCCYWFNWQIDTKTLNSQSVRIHIPRDQLFTPEALTALFQQFSKGGQS